PLVQVLFAWQSHDEGLLALPGVTVEPIRSDFDWVKFDLELILGEVDGTIQGGLNYASALYDHETIQRHTGYLRTILEAMTIDHAPALDRVPMLSSEEFHRWLIAWNRTDKAYPDRQCVHGWLERWAAETPGAPALACDEDTLTYATLNERANRLAHHLMERGVRSGDTVALCAEKGPMMFVALFAILKAGGTYVPLDPAYASARLDHILGDATPGLLLCDDIGRGALGAAALDAVEVIDMMDAEAWAGAADTNPRVEGLHSHGLAYIIYTSGSTGKPKGVMVEHHAVVNLGLSLADRLGVTTQSHVSQFASIGFDASIFETMMTLAAGGCLHLPSMAERQSPSAFMAFIGRRRITHATLAPAFLQSHPEPPRWSHRPMLILVGEAFNPALLKDWAPYARLANAYGPTEITVCASAWVAPDDLDELSVVPVGRALDNTRLYLLDAQGQPVPRGSVGELYIGGVGVARGYLGLPDLTNERFIPDPFDDRPGARMYRSGDLMRQLPDGHLVFLRRDDNQIKLRGFRIEPGEIEVQLNAHPAVRQSIVLVREDRPGDPRLVAYVMTAPGDGLASRLRDHLIARLPGYMVPSAFVMLDMLPLTAHGKLDRLALPAPDDDALIRGAYAEPQGGAEIRLAALWAELLGVTRVGREDHFFELGGQSLLVARLVARISDTFGVPVAIRDAFESPVLKDMAKLVTSTSDAAPRTWEPMAELVLDDSIRAEGSAASCVSLRHILLTGASGFLGAFLLSSLLAHGKATIHCLVRCRDVADGLARIDANMQALGLAGYDRTRITAIPGDLSRPRLGLDEPSFEHLANLVDVIYHNGAAVNSLHGYASLKAANVGGTEEILRLASRGTPKHVHYISTLSTIPSSASIGPDIATEAQLLEHWAGLETGYAQSKWVAERLLRIAGQRGLPFTIYRPTHIAGARSNGATNATDTWSLFVDACLTLERVPDVDTSINSIPVDYMADAIVELSSHEGIQGKEFNLSNPRSFRLHELTKRIEALDDLDVKRIDYRQWWNLCNAHPETRRIATVMPSELSASSTEVTTHTIAISNAVVELARAGMPCPEITVNLLGKYIAWHYSVLARTA
ncbi:putative NRPS-like enzyme, partial [Aureobasidium melanogenum]